MLTFIGKFLCKHGYHSYAKIWSGWIAYNTKFKTGYLCTRKCCVASRIETDDLFDGGKPDILDYEDGFVTLESKGNKKFKAGMEKLTFIRAIDPKFWDIFFQRNKGGVSLRNLTDEEITVIRRNYFLSA